MGEVINYVENAYDRFSDPSDLTRGCDPQVPPFTLSCGVWLGIFYHSCGVCLNGWESAPSADGWPWHVRRKTLSSTNLDTLGTQRVSWGGLRVLLIHGPAAAVFSEPPTSIHKR